MQKIIEKIFRKYKVIATTSDEILAKEIADAIINSITENHTITLKSVEQAQC